MYGLKSTRQGRTFLASKYTVPCEDPDASLEVIHEHLALHTELDLSPEDRAVDHLHTVRRAHGKPSVLYVEYTSETPSITTTTMTTTTTTTTTGHVQPPVITMTHTSCNCCVLL